MSEAPEARKVDCFPALAIVLHAPLMFTTIKEEKIFMDEVHKALSRGTMVVVKGWNPRVLREFTLDSFELAGFSADQWIVCHGEGGFFLSYWSHFKFCRCQAPHHSWMQRPFPTPDPFGFYCES